MTTDQEEVPAKPSICEAVLHNGEAHGLLSRSVCFPILALPVIYYVTLRKLINPDGVSSYP